MKFSAVSVALGRARPFIPALLAAHFPAAGKESSVAPVRAISMLNIAHQELAAGVFDHMGTAKQKIKKNSALLDWESKFALLRAFKKAHGHCRVPPNFIVGGVRLGGWVATQRKEYKKHRLGFPSRIINEKRIARLERHNFQWDPVGEDNWSPMNLFALGGATADLAIA